jgi:Natural resistance-associated macrophage protein
MLVIAQVVLALQLPFTLIPLIKGTSSKAMMGPFASSWLRSGTAWAASSLVSAANLLMLLDMLRLDAPEPHGADGLKEWSVSGGFGQWRQRVAQVFRRCSSSQMCLAGRRVPSILISRQCASSHAQHCKCCLKQLCVGQIATNSVMCVIHLCHVCFTCVMSVVQVADTGALLAGRRATSSACASSSS